MFRFLFILMLLLSISGCRFTVQAEKLGLHVAVDQAAYLSDEDPTTYMDDTVADPNPID